MYYTVHPAVSRNLLYNTDEPAISRNLLYNTDQPAGVQNLAMALAQSARRLTHRNPMPSRAPSATPRLAEVLASPESQLRPSPNIPPPLWDGSDMPARRLPELPRANVALDEPTLNLGLRPGRLPELPRADVALDEPTLNLNRWEIPQPVESSGLPRLDPIVVEGTLQPNLSADTSVGRLRQLEADARNVQQQSDIVVEGTRQPDLSADTSVGRLRQLEADAPTPIVVEGQPESSGLPRPIVVEGQSESSGLPEAAADTSVGRLRQLEADARADTSVGRLRELESYAQNAPLGVGSQANFRGRRVQIVRIKPPHADIRVIGGFGITRIPISELER